MSGDLHSAHKQALIYTLFEERKDDPEFRMPLWERVGWRAVKAWCRCRDALQVLRGRAQVRVVMDD